MSTQSESPSYDLQLRAYRRAGEAPFIGGNRVTLLQDGPTVYGAWLREIENARYSIFLENYIIHHDQIGTKMVNALAKKAAAGVHVYVLYDWLGSLGTSRSLWHQLTQAGAVVRAFNPFQFSNPLIASQRNHSKLLCIDGNVGFVGGLCIGDSWVGDKALKIEPWRDTAVRIEGPGALALCHAFDTTWSLCGEPLPREEFATLPPTNEEGLASIQVVRGLPGRARMYRELQALLSTATSKVWITDAYFILPAPIYEALLGAARDGVDVRVLVPRHSDLAAVSWVSRSGYTNLLEAGVRIFEWEGPMLHAKSGVVDGRWSRVGSSNMNFASFFTNYELDIMTEDLTVARQMEESFLKDLKHTSELVLLPKRRFRQQIRRSISIEHGETSNAPSRSSKRVPLRERNHKARAAVARAGAAVLGIALRRPFEQSAWSTSTVIAMILTVVGMLGLWKPKVLGMILTLICLWFGIGFVLESISEWKKRRRHKKALFQENIEELDSEEETESSEESLEKVGSKNGGAGN